MTPSVQTTIAAALASTALAILALGGAPAGTVLAYNAPANEALTQEAPAQESGNRAGDAFYTVAQADRGEALYNRNCLLCHGGPGAKPVTWKIGFRLGSGAMSMGRVIVDPKNNLSLKLGVEDRYNSNPGSGKKKNSARSVMNTVVVAVTRPRFISGNLPRRK